MTSVAMLCGSRKRAIVVCVFFALLVLTVIETVAWRSRDINLAAATKHVHCDEPSIDDHLWNQLAPKLCNKLEAPIVTLPCPVIAEEAWDAKQKRPLLSVVICGRNDMYGGSNILE
jgi:hypothetical protein